MSLIELLVVALVCSLLALIGRGLFGPHGWLLGEVPFGLVVFLIIFMPIFVRMRKLIIQIFHGRKKTNLS
jgi:hypothetical protein